MFLSLVFLGWCRGLDCCHACRDCPRIYIPFCSWILRQWRGSHFCTNMYILFMDSCCKWGWWLVRIVKKKKKNSLKVFMYLKKINCNCRWSYVREKENVNDFVQLNRVLSFGRCVLLWDIFIWLHLGEDTYSSLISFLFTWWP